MTSNDEALYLIVLFSCVGMDVGHQFDLMNFTHLPLIDYSKFWYIAAILMKIKSYRVLVSIWGMAWLLFQFYLLRLLEKKWDLPNCKSRPYSFKPTLEPQRTSLVQFGVPAGAAAAAALRRRRRRGFPASAGTAPRRRRTPRRAAPARPPWGTSAPRACSHNAHAHSPLPSLPTILYPIFPPFLVTALSSFVFGQAQYNINTKI